jgi:hypothetical protein
VPQQARFIPLLLPVQKPRFAKDRDDHVAIRKSDSELPEFDQLGATVRYGPREAVAGVGAGGEEMLDLDRVDRGPTCGEGERRRLELGFRFGFGVRFDWREGSVRDGGSSVYSHGERSGEGGLICWNSELENDRMLIEQWTMVIR